MPGPLKGLGKFWNIDNVVWSNLRLYPVDFGNKLCILIFIILSIWPNFFDPPFTAENFLVPLHFAQPPTKVFMNTPLLNHDYRRVHLLDTRDGCWLMFSEEIELLAPIVEEQVYRKDWVFWLFA